MNECIVRLNGLNWHIFFVASGHPMLQDNNDEITMGITHFDRLEAYIRVTGISKAMIERVCRHELVHIALFSYGFDGSDMSEENIANFFECYGKEIVDDAKFLAEKAFKAIDDRGGNPSQQLTLENMGNLVNRLQQTN